MLGVVAMSHLFPILACGNMGITSGDIALFLLLAASWLAACILSIVNLVIIVRVSSLMQFGFFVAYVGLALFLFCLPKVVTNGEWAGLIGETLTIAIPLLVMGHFVFLLIYRRRFKYGVKHDAS
jgi:hypothetical protein